MVGEFNGCQYCLAAHTAIATVHGMTKAEVKDVRQGQHTSTQKQALIDFVKAVLINKGAADEPTWRSFLQAGYTHEEAVEVVAQVAKNVGNNYINRLADTAIDLPLAELL